MEGTTTVAFSANAFAAAGALQALLVMGQVRVWLTNQAGASECTRRIARIRDPARSQRLEPKSASPRNGTCVEPVKERNEGLWLSLREDRQIGEQAPGNHSHVERVCLRGRWDSAGAARNVEVAARVCPPMTGLRRLRSGSVSRDAARSPRHESQAELPDGTLPTPSFTRRRRMPHTTSRSAGGFASSPLGQTRSRSCCGLEAFLRGHHRRRLGRDPLHAPRAGLPVGVADAKRRERPIGVETIGAARPND